MDSNFREQLFWALGNICGDSASLQSLCLATNYDAFLRDALAEELNNPNQTLALGYSQTHMWAVGNIFRHGHFEGDAAAAKNLLPIVKRFLVEHSQQADLTCGSIWAVHYIALGGPEQCKLLLESGTAKIIIGLLSHTSANVVSACRYALRTMFENDETARYLIEKVPGTLENLATLLTHTSERVRESLMLLLEDVSGTVKKIHSVSMAEAMVSSRILEGLWSKSALHGTDARIIRRVAHELSYGQVESLLMSYDSFPRCVTANIDNRQNRQSFRPDAVGAPGAGEGERPQCESGFREHALG